MDLQSQSWEYASEMVLKSVRMNLRTNEVPVRFLKDQEGRTSHHKRAGWFSPWHAAWINMKANVYLRCRLLSFPAWLVSAAGRTASDVSHDLRATPFVGGSHVSLYWMLLGLTLSVLGLHGVYVGALARVIFDYGGERTRRWLGRFPYTRSVILSGVAVVGGAALAAPLLAQYLLLGLRLNSLGPESHLAVIGLMLIIAGAMTFTFTLALHAVAANVRRR
jgi:hypothetical protein